jgi:chromosome partitioning protein
MAAVVTLASLKGGTGKTTVALNLAVAAIGAGIHTVLVDLDPQQASAKWGDLRRVMGCGPRVLSAMAARLPLAIERAERMGAELVIIDTAAHAEGILTAAIEATDLVLMPCRPTVIDLQHLAATAQFAASRRKPTAVLLNAVQSRTTDAAQAMGAVTDMGLMLLPVAISHLVAYARALTAGQGVTEYEPEGKAAAEMRALLNEIKE